jgi:hypothetical protein
LQAKITNIQNMSARLNLFAFSILLTLAGCGNGPDMVSCIPKSLFVATDSLNYQYDRNLRLTSILYFSGRKATTPFLREDFTYQQFRLSGGTSTNLPTATRQNDRIWTLEYGGNGLPSKHISSPVLNPDEKRITVFTHDGQGRLVKALTTLKIPNFTDPIFIGGYTYQYNDKGNVTTVKYILSNGAGQQVEVLARENFTFDDNSTFYASSNDLTIFNVYVNRYAPNTNNVLTSSIIYTDYGSQFTQPVSVTFTNSYDDGGMVNASTAFGTLAFSPAGQPMFYGARYDCHSILPD